MYIARSSLRATVAIVLHGIYFILMALSLWQIFAGNVNSRDRSVNLRRNHKFQVTRDLEMRPSEFGDQRL